MEWRDIAYENGWSEWEEGESVVIYQVGEKLFLHHQGDIPWACSHWDEEREITWEEAIEIVEEWEKKDLPEGNEI